MQIYNYIKDIQISSDNLKTDKEHARFLAVGLLFPAGHSSLNGKLENKDSDNKKNRYSLIFKGLQ